LIVRVTGTPTTPGLLEVIIAVRVADGFTVWRIGDDEVVA
jgi:hypothetical protein